MRAAAYEVETAVTHHLDGMVDGGDEVDGRLKALGREVAEVGGGDERKVRRGDGVWDAELEHVLDAWPISALAKLTPRLMPPWM